MLQMPTLTNTSKRQQLVLIPSIIFNHQRNQIGLLQMISLCVDDYKKESDLIRDVNDFMMKTVGQHYHVHFLDHRSPLARIEALKTHLLPDSIDRDELARTFIQTVTADTQMMTNNTVKWVAEWEKLKVKVINTVYEKRLPAFFMRAVQHQY